MQQIMSRLNTGPQHGMLRHQPAAARLRRTTPNRNQIGSTHKALPRSRRASESARVAVSIANFGSRPKNFVTSIAN
jgi:hypothetical protein